MAKKDKIDDDPDASPFESQRRRREADPFEGDRPTIMTAAAGPRGNGALPAPPVPRRLPGDHGVWLIVAGMVAAAILVVVLIAVPGSRPLPEGTPLPDNEFTRVIGSVQGMLAPSSSSLPILLGKLILAALLGGIIGYRQRIHVEEYIVQAHVIICFTGALMMIIIGNEIVRAFGLLGAGSIVRYRTPVRDPKALASLFVTMAVGIAVGTGLFELALIGSVLIVSLQGFVGTIASRLPPTLYNPQRGYIMKLETEDGPGTIMRLKDTFAEHDIRYQLLEYDASSAKKVDITMNVEARANLTTEELTLLVFRDGVRSVKWEEDV